MKKLLLSAFLLMLTLSVNAQEKKSFEGALKELNLPEDQANQMKTFVKERNEKTVAVKALKLGTEEEKEKLKEINMAHNQRVNALIGKDKVKELNAYWQK